MPIHSHCGCKHDLEHCGHCDVVYCRKCSKEWGRYYYYYTYPYYTYPYYTYPQWGTATGGNITGTITHTHVGDTNA